MAPLPARYWPEILADYASQHLRDLVIIKEVSQVRRLREMVLTHFVLDQDGINPLAHGRCGCYFELIVFKLSEGYKSQALFVKLPSGECHNTSLMISQHWCRWWLGAARHQVINWTSVDLDLQHHMTSQGHNELTHRTLGQKGHSFAHIFKHNFLNVKYGILIWIQLELVTSGPVGSKSRLVQVSGLVLNRCQAIAWTNDDPM